MALVTASPPRGDWSFNSFLVLVYRYRKSPMFLPCHTDDTYIDTAIMICNRFISNTGLFQNILSHGDPKFTSALWTNLHPCFGTNLSFSTAYHPQKDVLAEIMIQTLEYMIRRFCAYGLELKYYYGSTHVLCNLYQLLNWHMRHHSILQLKNTSNAIKRMEFKTSI
ncbi:hypothetical protein O181_075524 [Austropuccinia psidii MF-1]|uniref:Integrase catalytic domain-containing protein n=1 Tax=Austropuccinia psidii MF-1 TaxID=1389203 RepID=A0A9Q3IEJ5_9BASI|nr:hypothetical protein [Austropuccinia psidii MF-1]